MMLGFLAELAGLPALFYNVTLSVRCPACGNPDAFLSELPEGGAGLACGSCWHRERFDGPPAQAVRAAVLKHAAGLLEAGDAGESDEAAAFTERLRRERPGPGDLVSLVLCLVDGDGRQLRPVSRPVEAAVTLPVHRRGELPALYLEALIDSLREALKGVPTEWFETPEYPGAAVRCEAVALAVTKCGGSGPPG
jgi:hypothetical protein